MSLDAERSHDKKADPDLYVFYCTECYWRWPEDDGKQLAKCIRFLEETICALQQQLETKSSQCREQAELIQQLLSPPPAAVDAAEPTTLLMPILQALDSAHHNAAIAAREVKVCHFRIDEQQKSLRTFQLKEERRVSILIPKLRDLLCSDEFLVWLDDVTREAFLLSCRSFHRLHRLQVVATRNFTHVTALPPTLMRDQRISWLSKCCNIQFRRQQWSLFLYTIQFLSELGGGLHLPLQTDVNGRYELFHVQVNHEERLVQAQLYRPWEPLDQRKLAASALVTHCPWVWLNGQLVSREKKPDDEKSKSNRGGWTVVFHLPS